MALRPIHHLQADDERVPQHRTDSRSSVRGEVGVPLQRIGQDVVADPPGGITEVVQARIGHHLFHQLVTEDHAWRLPRIGWASQNTIGICAWG